jgi:hypothetical protein
MRRINTISAISARRWAQRSARPGRETDPPLSPEMNTFAARGSLTPQGRLEATLAALEAGEKERNRLAAEIADPPSSFSRT